MKYEVEDPHHWFNFFIESFVYYFILFYFVGIISLKPKRKAGCGAVPQSARIPALPPKEAQWDIVCNHAPGV